MTSNPINTLETWLSLREQSMDEIRDSYSISEEYIDRETSYLEVLHLTKLYNPDIHPGRFYYRDGKFVLLYIGTGTTEVLKQLSKEMLQEYLGEPGIMLRSRAGKQFTHYVYPERGLAFSASSEGIRFFEIFPPMSFEEYKTIYYEDVPEFRK